ncbi:hypothetical protein DFLDMN_005235 [Cupriavidus sp. H19C3]
MSILPPLLRRQNFRVPRVTMSSVYAPSVTFPA